MLKPSNFFNKIYTQRSKHFILLTGTALSMVGTQLTFIKVQQQTEEFVKSPAILNA